RRAAGGGWGGDGGIERAPAPLRRRPPRVRQGHPEPAGPGQSAAASRPAPPHLQPRRGAMSASSLLEQRPKGQGNKVQNGSVHQKDGLNDDDFEPYLSPQARPERQGRVK
uniref:YTH N6-methyladenosine RNA binding protein 2 n=1 Tax=Cyanoderma ruficeps TaxID=181631 RepID=A0A8C3NW75_9PASS